MNTLAPHARRAAGGQQPHPLFLTSAVWYTMMKGSACLLLPLLVASCTCRSDGPPIQACFDMRPRHGDPEYVQQTVVSPVTFKWNATADAIVTPGQYIRVILEYEAGRVFKGFMIQARDEKAAEGTTPTLLGSFLTSDESKTLSCSNPNDSAVHINSEDKHFITVTWIAPEEIPDLFRFYYTVVESLDTFWVMQESPDRLLGRMQPLPGNELYIKIHGSLMTFAWGVLIPMGMILALFYKVVWPRGHWFYIHVVVMVIAVLIVIAGIIIILVHAEWKWLDTTDLNATHQVLGVIALAAVVINPCLGLFLICECCSLGTNWRKAYNFCHGSIGLIFAQGIALCAMLVGVHILREHPRNFDPNTVHNIIYSVSAVVATVVMIITLYNGYHIRYHKDHPKPDIHEEDPPRSNDWWFRLIAGGGITALLLAPVATTIYFLTTI